MKKFLLFPLFAILGCLFIGCSSDFEEDEVSDFEKVENAKLKIVEMANDYGVKIRLSDDISVEVIDNLDYNNIERLIKSLANINHVVRYTTQNKGTEYKLVKDIQLTRKRVQSRSVEAYYPRSTNFADTTGNIYTTLYVDDYSWECSCVATWKSSEDNNICCVELNPTVDLNYKPSFSASTTYYSTTGTPDYDWRETGNGGFTFDGEVPVSVFEEFLSPIDGYISTFLFETTIYMSGLVSNNGGTISWYN